MIQNYRFAHAIVGNVSALNIGCYIAFFIYCFFHLLESTNYSDFYGINIGTISKIAIAFALFLLLLKLICQRYNARTLFRILMVFLISLCVYIITGSWIPFSIALFVCSGRGLKIDVLMWILLVSSSLILVLVIGGTRLGLIKTIISHRYGEATVRSSLGFFQVNAVGLVIARICTAVAVLRWDRTKPIASVAIMVVAVGFIESTANSRTAELYITVLAIVFSIHAFNAKAKNNTSSKWHRFLFLIILTSVLLSWGLLVVFSPDNYNLMRISRILSHRVYSSWYYFKTYGITMLGNSNFGIDYINTIWVGDSYAALTVDNAWVLWLLKYGLIPSITLLFGIATLYKKAAVEHYYSGELVIFALICSLYAFSESSALSFDFNPMFLLMCPVIYGDSIVSVRLTTET